MEDIKQYEEKWQKIWDKEKVFESNSSNKPKYFITTPYPYMSGYLHLGHMFNYIFPELISRYKRLRGYNTLFSFGFHCTGTPIVAAAKRIKEKEKSQIKILKQLGFNDNDIPNFSDPTYWIKVFPKQTQQDLTKLGYSIDWRTSMITTELNPAYSKFVQWQYSQLKSHIKKGKHPVVWCSKDNTPVGDHARSEGEGETIQEFLLFKFQLDDDRKLITATLRPDTILGITNIYINPDEEYIEAKVNDEIWIIGKPIIKKLENQGYNVEILNTVKGLNFVGKTTKFLDKEIPVLPASFLKSDYGTGLVHSVPSESADDLIALKELQKNKKMIEKYPIIKEIKPIPIFNTEYIEEMGAEYFIKKYNITSQNQREKLEKIKKELYKLTFNKSKFNELYKNILGHNLEGKTVVNGQQIIKNELLKRNLINVFYELTGKVVCRCLTECSVKVVSDQWFIEYDDPKWKKQTHKCLNQMDIIPQKVRKQFDYVIDWLNKWACTRELGLGTKLPWDKKWMIESLSDSTIQMSYHSIAKYIEPRFNLIKPEQLTIDFFNYVFLNKKTSDEVSISTKIDKKLLEQIHKEFNYWYPYDYRNSAKDLIQNHLTMSLFHHVAIFPEKFWPKLYFLNGRVMVNNEKMSKSKGNFFTIKELYEKYSADAIRMTTAYAGETLDDANFDMTFLETSKRKLIQHYEFCINNYNKGKSKKTEIDNWFISIINQQIKDSTEALDNYQTKTALQKSFLDMQRLLKWYIRRTIPNKEVINNYIESVTKMLSIYAPHICEEIWNKIGKKTLITNESWPKYDNNLINEKTNSKEKLIESIIEDINKVIKLSKLDEISSINIYIADNWKYNLFNKLKNELEITRNPGEIIKKIMNDKELVKYRKTLQKIVPKLIKTGKLPNLILDETSEFKLFSENKEFLEKEFNAIITIYHEYETNEIKSNNAMPGKPSILVE